VVLRCPSKNNQYFEPTEYFVHALRPWRKSLIRHRGQHRDESTKWSKAFYHLVYPSFSVNQFRSRSELCYPQEGISGTRSTARRVTCGAEAERWFCVRHRGIRRRPRRQGEPWGVRRLVQNMARPGLLSVVVDTWAVGQASDILSGWAFWKVILSRIENKCRLFLIGVSAYVYSSCFFLKYK
jgi:hypothetical protein